MNSKILILCLILPAISFAQLFGSNKVGIIKDNDGFTFIRKGPAQEATVIDTLFTGEFFQFEPSDSSDWIKIYKMWNVNGYVHKSRIQDINKLSRNVQKIYLDSIFKKEAFTYAKRINKWDGKTSGLYNFHETKFVPSLHLFIKYMCDSFDERLFRKLLDILIIEEHSADETPSTALGFIFRCYPQKVQLIVNEYSSPVIKDCLMLGKGNVGVKN
ncbi:MAG: hypothetical protein ACJAZ2_002352 [Glaciecola sp.]|jgi:hypothetical protein